MKLFSKQAAGHGKMAQSDEFPGIIFKPLTKREALVYINITNKSPKLASIIPKFHGIFCEEDGLLHEVDAEDINAILHAESLSNEQVVPDYFIALENLIEGMSSPCIADFKIGCKEHTHDCDPQKRATQIEKCQRTTSWQYGFRISGFLSGIDEKFTVQKKDMPQISMEKTFQIIFHMLREARHPSKLKKALLAKLEVIYNIFIEQQDFFFISASILIVFDCFEQENLKVKIIDLGRTFTLAELLMHHVDLREDINPAAIDFCEKNNCSLKSDCNVIFGLKKLLETIEEVNV